MHYSKDNTFFDWFFFAFYIFKSELKKECINYKKKKIASNVLLPCNVTIQHYKEIFFCLFTSQHF